jgi:hypothetical protein
MLKGSFKKYMKVKVIATILLLTVLQVIQSCIDPFSPPEISSPEQFLVVDGFLNMSGDTSKIELRRTQNTTENRLYGVETGAKISVETDMGETYQFTEAGNGLYNLKPGNMNQSVKYRLNITTRNGSKYASAFVPVNKTPPIDSITYVHDKFLNAVVFKVNTHDPTNGTKFYRWKFEDTYEYYSAFYSAVMVKGKEVVTRTDDINHCWASGRSSNIILGSTVKLSKDEIKDLPINIVPVASNKLLVKYSMLVKQYGLSQEAFEYWTSLAKTTQGTGSLFDPQPSQVTGNIKNVANPKELVFGYFSAVVETKKRIFVTPRLGYYDYCELDTLPIRCGAPDEECVFNTFKLLVSYYDEDNILATPPDCADCRLRGGVTRRPIFWE